MKPDNPEAYTYKANNIMKCNCETCKGNGNIPCPDCNGQGEYDGNIERIVLVKTMKNYSELLELQQDAIRVRVQAERLMELNPSRKDSYSEQLDGCLSVINKQADKVAKR